jgi:hypothetical protein
MAAFIAEGDIWKASVACYCTTTQQVSFNRYLFYCSRVAGTGGTDQELATTLDGLLAPLYKPIMAASATYWGTKVSRYLLPPVNRPVTNITNTGIGTGGADMLPGAVAALLKTTTATNGRKGQGRVYIPFIFDGFATAAGQPVGALEVALGGIGNAIYTLAPVGAGANTSTMAWCLPNAKFAPNISQVLAYVGEPKFGTQHRRGDFGKLNTIPPF